MIVILMSFLRARETAGIDDALVLKEQLEHYYFLCSVNQPQPEEDDEDDDEDEAPKAAAGGDSPRDGTVGKNSRSPEGTALKQSENRSSSSTTPQVVSPEFPGSSQLTNSSELSNKSSSSMSKQRGIAKTKRTTKGSVLCVPQTQSVVSELGAFASGEDTDSQSDDVSTRTLSNAPSSERKKRFKHSRHRDDVSSKQRKSCDSESECSFSQHLKLPTVKPHRAPSRKRPRSVFRETEDPESSNWNVDLLWKPHHLQTRGRNCIIFYNSVIVSILVRFLPFHYVEYLLFFQDLVRISCL